MGEARQVRRVTGSSYSLRVVAWSSGRRVCVVWKKQGSRPRVCSESGLDRPRAGGPATAFSRSACPQRSRDETTMAASAARDATRVVSRRRLIVSRRCRRRCLPPAVGAGVGDGTGTDVGAGNVEDRDGTEVGAGVGTVHRPPPPSRLIFHHLFGPPPRRRRQARRRARPRHRAGLPGRGGELQLLRRARSPRRAARARRPRAARRRGSFVRTRPRPLRTRK